MPCATRCQRSDFKWLRSYLKFTYGIIKSIHYYWYFHGLLDYIKDIYKYVFIGLWLFSHNRTLTVILKCIEAGTFFLCDHDFQKKKTGTYMYTNRYICKNVQLSTDCYHHYISHLQTHRHALWKLINNWHNWISNHILIVYTCMLSLR